MPEIYFPIFIVTAHFLGDWVCQPRSIALNKSKDLSVLAEHIVILSIFLLPAIFFLKHNPAGWFAWLTINLSAHAIQDWYLWRIAAKFMKKVDKNTVYEKYSFWTIVGLDQWLHYMMYFVSYVLLK